MELWTDGAPLIVKSELLRTLKFEDRIAGMEPWTDGAPLIYKSELIQTSNSEDEAFDSWGAPDFAIRTLTNFVLRGWSLGHPWTGEATLVFKSELSRTSYSGDGALD